MDSLRLLSVSVTPVVLISASGLIILALYNRLAAILARIRAFHQQKIDLLRAENDSACRQLILNLLDSQIGKVTVKAKVIQRGLYCLLSAVVAFLLCSFFASESGTSEWVGRLALGCHRLGLLLFLVGIGWGIRELTLSITPLEEESAYLEMLTAQNSGNPPSDDGPRTFKIAG